MKKKVIISVGITAALVALVVGIVTIFVSRKFELSAEYRENSGFETVSVEGLKSLIDEKKSFAVFVYQPACRASDELEQIIQGFGNEAQVKFLKVAFSGLRDSGLVEGLKYYPSVVLYRDGEVVSFLKANEDEDLDAYQSEEGFTEWWNQYVRN